MTIVDRYELRAAVALLEARNEPHGYACKSCGNPSPLGVGYALIGADAFAASAAVQSCPCGYSVAPVSL